MKVGSNADNRIKGFFTPGELAEFMAISKPTIYRLVGRRQIPFHKIGGVLRFKKYDIARYLENNRIDPIEM
jgi:excisionase family DNA binding protein